MTDHRARVHRLWGAALVAAALATPAAAATITDVQARALDAQHWMLRLRASGPLAFDVVPARRGTFAVRLYRARLGTLPPRGPTPFGTVVLTQERTGHALLRITLADPQSRVTASQGGNAGEMEVRIGR